MKRALVLLFNKVEELEAVAPIDIMRRANIEVCTASMESELNVVGRSGITIECENLFDDVYEQDFDLILIPGGPGVYTWTTFPPLLHQVAKQHHDGGWVAAICAAPLLLKEAGILQDTKCTGHSSIVAKLPNCQAELKVVSDKKVITSRGAGTAIEFGLKIVEELIDAKTSNDIAQSIHFTD